jgi:hypothetical protein
MASGFFRPDDSSAVSVEPTSAPVGTPGFFTDGSLTSPATIVGADFLNGLIDEIQNLANVGGIPLSKTTPTIVPNILALITASLTNYVLKTGDVMSGNLTLGTNYGGNNNTSSLIVQSGASTLNVVVNASVAAFNATTQAGDTLIWYTDGSSNTGALTIAPWGLGGGIRLDNTGAVTINRPLTLTSTLAISGAATGATPGAGDYSTSLATTAWYAGQGASLTALMDGSANVGSSNQFARQDHIHPTDTSRAPVFNAVLTGTPVAPQAAASTNTTQIATTSFVMNQASGFTPLTDGASTPGTSPFWSRHDHVHGTDGSRQANLGFTPVQQGGGASQNGNKIFLGWDGVSIRGQVDGFDLGDMTLNSMFSINYAANGHAFLPNGLLFNWGTGDTSTGQLDVIAFDRPYPNYIASITVSEGNAGGWDFPAPATFVTIFGTNRIPGNNAGFYLSVTVVGQGGGLTHQGGINFNWFSVGW